jgi:hypothetical protein
VADLDESNAALRVAQRFHDAVDAISGETENHFDAPIFEVVD